MAHHSQKNSRQTWSYTELKPLVALSMDAGLSTLILGHPGVGKSTLAADIAADRNLPMVDIRLAQSDATDLAGIYMPNHEQRCLARYTPDWVQQVSEAPALVFLDEINAAVTRLHQAAAYQIVLEHRVGSVSFHPETVVLAAGNFPEDNAIVTQLSSALCNRFVHFNLRVDARCWLRWASHHRIDESIIAYISRFGEDALYANRGETAFPSPRSWTMASHLLSAARPEQEEAVVASCIGAPASKAFFNFRKILRRVKADAIINGGKRIDFRNGKNAEPSFMHAAVFSIAAWLRREATISESALSNIINFMASPGLDPEYTFLFLKQLKSHPDLLHRLKCLDDFRHLIAGLVDLHVGQYQ